MRKPVIGVMGGSKSTPQVDELAEAVGAAIAKEDWILLNGGRNEGVMAASARGAHAAGGFAVGILPGERGDEDAAPGLSLHVYSGIGFARNAMNVQTSDVVLVLPGATGTLSEAAYAVTYGRPCILLGFDDGGVLGDHVERASTVEDAIDRVRRFLGKRAD